MSDAVSGQGADGYKHIAYTVADGVGQIVLNRPDKLNTLGVGPGSNRAEILEALGRADSDDGVGCILITARGNAFCAGGDLTATPTASEGQQQTDIDKAVVEFYEQLGATRKAVIAAVHGLCLGAGIGMVAQCDIVLASRDARFGLVEGRLGYPGATELVALVGPAWAKFLLLTGELIPAHTAEQIGLTLVTVEPADLEEAARDLARRIASTPRHASQLNKATISAVSDAMGRHDGRVSGRVLDVATRAAAAEAEAPDGRRFADIMRAEGIDGLKRARDQQFTGSWLSRYAPQPPTISSRIEDSK